MIFSILMNIIRSDQCDVCKKILQHEDIVVALIPDVQIDKRFSVGRQGIIRLKLSSNSIDSRTLKIYCKDCLTVEDYLSKD